MILLKELGAIFVNFQRVILAGAALTSEIYWHSESGEGSKLVRISASIGTCDFHIARSVVELGIMLAFTDPYVHVLW